MAKGKYAVELVAGVNGAQFNVAGQEVELAEGGTFETDDERVAAQLLAEHPFLKPKSTKG